MLETWDKTNRQIYELVDKATSSTSAERHDGKEFLGTTPDQAAMRVLKLNRPSGRYVLRFVEEPARQAFEWVVELTLDAQGQPYQHYLLRPDGSLFEAYGRELFPADDNTASQLLDKIQLILSQSI